MDTAKINDIADASIDRHAFSGVVAICHQDTALYERAANYADRSNKIANTLPEGGTIVTVRCPLRPAAPEEDNA